MFRLLFLMFVRIRLICALIKITYLLTYLLTMAGIPYTNTPLCYLRPLPAWVCMSIRLPMFSSYYYDYYYHYYSGHCVVGLPVRS